jgi:midasin
VNDPKSVAIVYSEEGLTIGDFSIPRGSIGVHRPESFHFDAPTAAENVFRVARALVSDKPIMLEGSPGSGKSSLIVSLAAATGNKLVRLNLSEQTVCLLVFRASDWTSRDV